MIEGHDPADHTVGLLQAVVQVSGHGEGGPAEAQRVVGHNVQQRDGRAHVGTHDRQREAGIDRVECGQLLGVLTQHSGELAHLGRACPCRHERPGVLRHGSRPDDAVDLLG
jgi:hypothetical protein